MDVPGDELASPLKAKSADRHIQGVRPRPVDRGLVVHPKDLQGGTGVPWPPRWHAARPARRADAQTVRHREMPSTQAYPLEDGTITTKATSRGPTTTEVRADRIARLGRRFDLASRTLTSEPLRGAGDPISLIKRNSDLA